MVEIDEHFSSRCLMKTNGAGPPGRLAALDYAAICANSLSQELPHARFRRFEREKPNLTEEEES
jgi:hypothetical protein